MCRRPPVRRFVQDARAACLRAGVPRTRLQRPWVRTPVSVRAWASTEACVVRCRVPRVVLERETVVGGLAQHSDALPYRRTSSSFLSIGVAVTRPRRVRLRCSGPDASVDIHRGGFVGVSLGSAGASRPNRRLGDDQCGCVRPRWRRARSWRVPSAGSPGPLQWLSCGTAVRCVAVVPMQEQAGDVAARSPVCSERTP